jgi:hypothetical protein
MSDDYNEQVEDFNIDKLRKLPELSASSSLFSLNWTSLGNSNFNPELAKKLSFLTPQVSVSGSSLNFNVYQTVDREDLQLLKILQTDPSHKEAMIVTFDKTGKRLPFYVVLGVYELTNFSFNHDWDESWEAPVTSFTVQAISEVRSK